MRVKVGFQTGVALATVMFMGCTTDARVGSSAGASMSAGDGTGDDVGMDDGLDDGVLDLPGNDDDGMQVCTVNEGTGSAPGNCTAKAPPDSFESVLEWKWEGAGDETFAIATPLVANLTDDNGDGEINICDTPDIVVPVFSPDNVDVSGMGDMGLLYDGPAHIYVLDGATGAVHFKIEDRGWWWATPALGDIDGDGLPEIVMASSILGPLEAWNHDGTPLEGWNSTFTETDEDPSIDDPTKGTFQWVSPPTIADLDHDASPEIIVGKWVFDNTGALVASLDVADVGIHRPTLVADLDEDGREELIFGAKAFTWLGDGQTEVYYDNADVGNGQPAIADFSGDGHPEILVSGNSGLSLLDYEGNTLAMPEKPIVDDGNESWGRPVAIHDFDGDGAPEFAVSVGASYVLLQYVFGGPSPVLEMEGQWNVLDASGLATGTAFDFLGDGSAEAMYGDETRLWVFDSSDDTLPALVEEPRTSRTLVEHPVVADVDNDGSAEIIVVSNEDTMDNVASPTVQVYGDAQDRWIQARRVWNQHAYTITNVLEDGRIPQNPTPSWKAFNTFRTNAQIENGEVCVPPAG